MVSASNIIPMLNITWYFEKHHYLEESTDSMFLTGLAMISGWKFV